MRLFLAFTFALAMLVSAFGQSTTGDITAMDPKNNTITVSAGATSTTYRSRASSEIFINGTKRKFEELSEGMTVKIKSSEPGIATRIDASGTLHARSQDVATQSLEQRLIGTKWLWWEGNEQIQFITFREKGRAIWSIKQRGEFTWKVVPGENRIEGVSPARGKKFRITFNEALTKGKIYEGDDRPRETYIVKD